MGVKNVADRILGIPPPLPPKEKWGATLANIHLVETTPAEDTSMFIKEGSSLDAVTTNLRILKQNAARAIENIETIIEQMNAQHEALVKITRENHPFGIEINVRPITIWQLLEMHCNLINQESGTPIE